ncbi:MAG: hypothetical protein ABR498_02575 [Candidatus Dormibacteria bacterium]
MSEEFSNEQIPTWDPPEPLDGGDSAAGPALDWPTPATDWPAPASEPSTVPPPADANAAPVAPPDPRTFSLPVADPTPVVTPAPLPRPSTAPATGSMVAGGPGWNIRRAPQPLQPGAPQPEPVLPVAYDAPPPGAPLPWEQPPAKASGTIRYLFFAVALFAICGVAALVVTGVGHKTHSISEPTTVGALAQVNVPQLDTLLTQVQDLERSAGATNVVVAMYGSGNKAGMMLMVVQNGTVSGGSNNMQSFMRGFSSGLGATGWKLDTTQQSVNTVNGTTFDCAPMTSTQMQGVTFSTCAWTEDGVAGAVVDFTGLSPADTLNETVQARSAGVR